MSSLPYNTHELPDGTLLSRKELQHYLKQWKLRANGTTEVMRMTYNEVKHGRHSGGTPQSPAKKKKSATSKKAPVEKRLKRFRGSCPSKIMDRIQRAVTQRLYLIKHGEVSSDLSCDFIVLGSTGNVYNVQVSKQPSCNCPDHAKGNHPCKHILFVYIKVMGLPTNSPHIYQLALLSNELGDMFACMEARRVGGFMANAHVQSTYAKLERGVDVDLVKEDSGVQRRSLDQDADCPICFDDMKRCGPTSIVYCRTQCGTNFHADCIRRWFQHNRNCPNCRQPWQDNTSNSPSKRSGEGYTNLGRLQGQSPVRDTSTYRSYSPWKRRRYW